MAERRVEKKKRKRRGESFVGEEKKKKKRQKAWLWRPPIYSANNSPFCRHSIPFFFLYLSISVYECYYLSILLFEIVCFVWWILPPHLLILLSAQAVVRSTDTSRYKETDIHDHLKWINTGKSRFLLFLTISWALGIIVHTVSGQWLS